MPEAWETAWLTGAPLTEGDVGDGLRVVGGEVQVDPGDGLALVAGEVAVAADVARKNVDNAFTVGQTCAGDLTARSGAATQTRIGDNTGFAALTLGSAGDTIAFRDGANSLSIATGDLFKTNAEITVNGERVPHIGDADAYSARGALVDNTEVTPSATRPSLVVVIGQIQTAAGSQEGRIDIYTGPAGAPIKVAEIRWDDNDAVNAYAIGGSATILVAAGDVYKADFVSVTGAPTISAEAFELVL